MTFSWREIEQVFVKDGKTVSRGGKTSEEGGRGEGDLMQVCERESEMLPICL